MRKSSSSHRLTLLGLLVLSACGGGSGSGDAASVAPSAAPADQSALWRSQNPSGEALTLVQTGRSVAQSATAQGGMAFLGDIAVGTISGNAVVGGQGQVLARIGTSGGDMKQAERATALGSGIVNAPNQKWPNGVIPYEIDGAASGDTRNAFEGAKNDYHAKTVIRFVPRTNEANYIHIITGDGCWSYVGTIGGRQDLSLGNGCGVNPARHELGHAVGLAHEQVRQDRDNYVVVNLDLTGGGRSQYEIDRGSAGTPIGPYDFESMMHYKNYLVNGRWIFEPKNGFPPDKIGNDRLNTFSPGDLGAIAALYGSPVAQGATFRVRNRNSGKVLGVDGMSTNDSANVVQFDDTGTPDHLWRIVDAGGGNVKLQNVNSGKVLAVEQASTADSARAQQFADNGTADHLWQLVDIGNGWTRIRNTRSGRMLGVAGMSTANSAQVVQFFDNGSADHDWLLIPNGQVKIQNLNSGKLLAVEQASMADSARVQQFADTGTADHLWTFAPAADGSFLVRNVNSGKVLGVAGMSTADSAQVVQFADTGTPDHLWRLRIIGGGPGTSRLQNVNSGKVLAVQQASLNDSTNVEQFGDTGTVDHAWRIN